MDEFKEFDDQIDVIRDAAAEKAENLIKGELRALETAFPGHSFQFQSGMYDSYVVVTPPIHGQSSIKEYDIENQPHAALRDVSDKPRMQFLRRRLHRMGEIATVLEDTFRRGLAPISSATAPTAEDADAPIAAGPR